MEELLFGLTPSEFWAFNYLLYLAKKQGDNRVILPRPGEDPRAEKMFSRKHLKRLLRALKAKRRLTHLLIPTSKSKQIEVFLSIRETPIFGDMGVPNPEKGCTGVPNMTTLGTPRSAKTGLGTCTSPISEVISRALPNLPRPKLKLIESFKKLGELKQKDLRGELAKLSEREIFLLSGVGREFCKFEPKGRKLSERAKLYARIRFLQEGDAIGKPQPWVDQVARAYDREAGPGGSRATARRAGEPVAVGAMVGGGGP
jgi:hypothetical protein